MRKLLYTFVLTVFCGIIAFAQIPPELTELITNDGHLGDDYKQVLLDWKESGTDALPIPEGNAIQIDVTDYGVIPSWHHSCGDSLVNLIHYYDTIADSSNIIILYFPPNFSPYLIDKPIVLTGGIILKGGEPIEEGGFMNRTLFFQHFWDTLKNPLISITGDDNGVEDIEINTFTLQANIPYTFNDNKELVYKVSGMNFLTCVMNTEVKDEDGNIVCKGSGMITGMLSDTAIFECSEIDPMKTYSITTVFTDQDYYSSTYKHDVGGSSQMAEIMNAHNVECYIEAINDKQIDNFSSEMYQPTINISGDNNWIRGVESIFTRRFHISLTGESNTISGNYFHKSISYTDNSGRGYGVLFTGNAKKNKLEDNVFDYLRHAILLQVNAERNVIAYNHSETVHAVNCKQAFCKKFQADDLCFHGSPHEGDSGANRNLLEGNCFVRSRVDNVKNDDDESSNGPYNTFFRCHTSKPWSKESGHFFKIEYYNDPWEKERQYAQNVIGCHMDPIWTPLYGTLWKLEIYGVNKWYDNYDWWKYTPKEYCSFYLEEKPSFFSAEMSWPYYPDYEAENPARKRFNESKKGSVVPIAIYQGWDDYIGLCNPPSLKFTNKEWNQTTKDYTAMDKIVISNSAINKKNILTFKTKNKVILTSGTKIMDGNYVSITTGDVCESKEGFSKYSFYKQYLIQEKQKLIIEPIIKEKEKFRIFPNPNNGVFIVEGIEQINKDNLYIYDTFGNNLHFSLSGNKVSMLSKYTGIILVKIFIKNQIRNFKLVVNRTKD